ncbi:MAG TPA: ATP-dependent helicase HrpB [Caulobacteraceae bacterium]|jgi:ATP-dependent helicase HrpB
MLPIHDALPALKAALAERDAAVLVAPPGAGKTTVTPLELLPEPWVAGGKLILLEPRRIAARAAAERMAATLGEAVGETVGYRVRLASRVSARTRIEVVTEGVFTRMIESDPGLDGVAAVLFDEFHERSLDADLGLAFARDSQEVLRDDLKLVVMSATLDAAPVAALLGDAPIVESQGRMFPVETRYLGRDPALRIEDQVARAIRRALASETGSLLVFLPGQGEILRVAERLAAEALPPAMDIAPLYGALDPRAQDAAIAAAAPGRRKVVLATAIAQTSLTIEGVRVVIDAGLARVPRYDPASGLTRLETVRVTAAAADQRRGRAGRIEPGVCYRLWDERETRGLVPFDRPEILEADLSALVLDLALWGAGDGAGLAFLDRPPGAAMAEARTLLQRLGALDASGAITPHGRRMSNIALPPRLAHMVLRGAASGQGERAARIAALMVERGLGGRSADLETRLESFGRDRGPRARDAGQLAARWAREAGKASGAAPLSDALLLAEAWPERIAKARGAAGQFQLASGRGAHLEATESLAKAAWLAVAELGGGEARDRILLAAELDPAELTTTFADRLSRDASLVRDTGGRLRALERLMLGRLVLEERRIADPDKAMIVGALLDEVRQQGLAALPWGESSQALRARAAFASGPDLSDETLLAVLDAWLAPELAGKSALAQLTDAELEASLRAHAGYDAIRALDRAAPARFTAPTGSTFAIDYGAEGGPRIDVRVQELYGLDAHPVIAGQPLTLALLSPAHRPIQLTKDLPGFWRGAWAEVRKEMRGRYPRHVWPEDPANSAPTTRAKPRGT